MSNVKISQLPAATTPLGGTEVLPLVQGTTTKKVTVAELRSTAVTAVTGTAPVVSSGGLTPAISMAAASTSTSGYLTSTDWNTFNGKYSTGGALGTPSSGTATNLTGLPLTTGVTGTLPIANGGTGTTTPALVAGSNVTITGTWPNQTIASTGGSSGVTSFSAGSTGLTPSTASTGVVTLAGTLAVANGGTGTTTPSLVAGTNVSITGTWPNQTINSSGGGGGGMVYPGAGIGNSTGTAWGTSYSTTGTGTVVALATSPTFVTPVLGTPTSGVATNLTGLPLTTGVTGTLPVLNGGTGVTTSTGTGSVVLSTSPTLVTPLLGTPTSGVATNLTGLPLTTGVTGTLGLANGGTGQTTAAAAITALTGTQTSAYYLRSNGTNATLSALAAADLTGTVAIASGGTGQTTAAAAITALTGTQTTAYYLRSNGTNSVLAALAAADVTGTLAVANGGTGVTTSTGTGSVVLSTSPTLVTPLLGTPTSGVATNLTGLPLTTGVTGTLPVANGGTGVTTSTGSGNTVLSTSPTLVTPVLGTPTSGNLSSCTADGTNAVGYLNIPINSQSAAYTLVLADAGKAILHPSTDANARTFTIPANGTVAFAIGTAVTFINMTSQVVSIAITTDTLYLGGTGTTGTRSLAQYGTATCIKMTSTTWIINGSGLS